MRSYLMKIIQTQNALKPAGHYSQAIIHNDLLYLSGQLPLHPETGEKILGTAIEQARQIFTNIGLILKEAGTTTSKVLKLVIYISDVALWDDINTVCGEFFIEHKPVRTIVPTRDLHFGFQIEIDCIAVC